MQQRRFGADVQRCQNPGNRRQRQQQIGGNHRPGRDQGPAGMAQGGTAAHSHDHRSGGADRKGMERGAFGYNGAEQGETVQCQAGGNP